MYFPVFDVFFNAGGFGRASAFARPVRLETPPDQFSKLRTLTFELRRRVCEYEALATAHGVEEELGREQTREEGRGHEAARRLLNEGDAYRTKEPPSLGRRGAPLST